MPKIKYSPEALRRFSDEMSGISSVVSEIEGSYSNIARAVDHDIRELRGIDGDLRTIERNLESDLASLKRMSAFLEEAAGKYQATAEGLANAVKGGSDFQTLVGTQQRYAARQHGGGGGKIPVQHGGGGGKIPEANDTVDNIASFFEELVGAASKANTALTKVDPNAIVDLFKNGVVKDVLTRLFSKDTINSIVDAFKKDGLAGLRTTFQENVDDIVTQYSDDIAAVTSVSQVTKDICKKALAPALTVVSNVYENYQEFKDTGDTARMIAETVVESLFDVGLYVVGLVTCPTVPISLIVDTSSKIVFGKSAGDAFADFWMDTAAQAVYDAGSWVVDKITQN